MSNNVRMYQVLIASPGDVSDLRALVPPLLTEWNDIHKSNYVLHPQMWEHNAVPEAGRHPQDALDEQLVEESDLLVAVFWGRLGTPTETATSGTLQEIDTFIRLKGPKRVMIYFYGKPLDSSPYEIDVDELRRLQDYRRQISNDVLFAECKNEDEFKHSLYKHLDAKVTNLSSGKLPVPRLDVEKNATHSEGVASSDAWPMGGTLESVGRRFLEHWQGMMARGDKYRAEGASLLQTAAIAIDSLTASSSLQISDEDASFLDRISIQLKRLAGSIGDVRFKGAPMKFWWEGEEIAKNLDTQIQFMIDRGRAA